MTDTVLESREAANVNARSIKLSIIIEWANTEYNGCPRAQGLLDILGQQWRGIQCREYPESLTTEARQMLEHFDATPQMLIVSGAPLSVAEKEQIKAWTPDCFELEIHVSEGTEYYGLKNLGAEISEGEILLFVDSDVHPLPEWFAHLLGSFSQPELQIASGQPFVVPGTVFVTAFSLGWIFDLPDETGRLNPPRKFYTSNIAFRSEIFRMTRFPKLVRRTRGGATLMGRRLESLGHSVWQNGRALVDHPAPANLRHMVIRALAHGRDMYMKESEERTWRGLLRSQSTAARRLARGFSRTFRYRRRVGLRVWNVPLVLIIISTYYGLFAMSGILTHLSPRVMGGLFRL
ncbi:MAG: glycosyltransferase [Planctomycetaceae bacterium]